MLNQGLDSAELRKAFAIDGRLRVPELFDAAAADRIRQASESRTPFEYLFFLDGQNYALSEAEMRGLDRQRATSMQKGIGEAAANGVGFFYCGYKLGREDRATSDPELRFLHEVFDYLNSEEMRGFIREITGVNDIDNADAQYTRYTPGQFLTRHRDDVASEHRRIAYVYSLTQGWHPDWGGLLQFFEDDGTPRDAWLPAFNTLSLFEVRHVHSVTYVTPFARSSRLSLTGWFRSQGSS